MNQVKIKILKKDLKKRKIQRKKKVNQQRTAKVKEEQNLEEFKQVKKGTVILGNKKKGKDSENKMVQMDLRKEMKKREIEIQ